MGIGYYYSLLGGLTPNTTYYVKAYATNEAGTAYGEELSFKTKDVSGLNGLWTQGSIVVGTDGIIDGVAFSPDGSIVMYQDGNTFEIISSNPWYGGPASTMYTRVGNLMTAPVRMPAEKPGAVFGK